MKASGGVSKRWRFGFVVFYALVLISPFFSSFTAPLGQPLASAADPKDPNYIFDNNAKASWVDLAHITYGSVTYVENTIDNDWHFINNAQPSNCYDEINGLEDGPVPAKTRVTFNHRWLYTNNISGTTNKCVDDKYTITLTGQDKEQVAFTWHDSNTIQSADGNKIYSLNSGNLFIAGESTCRDTITIDPKNLGTAQLALRLDLPPGVNNQETARYITLANQTLTGTSHGNVYGYQGFPFEHSINGLIQRSLEPSSGCIYTTPITIKIGATDQAKAPVNQATVCVSSNCPATQCQITGGFGWIFCPLIDGANQLYNGSGGDASQDPSNPGGLKGEVVHILNTGPLNKANYGGAQAVWGAFRGLANIFFIIIFLIIIFSNTLSIGMSNYDIKKVLPRLVAAAILVQFSWVLMQLAVDVTNIFGSGIGSLIVSALNSVHSTAKVLPADVINNVSLIFWGGTAIIVTAFFLLPMLLAIFGFIMGILAVFLTLEFRKVLILILVVLSPLAFVAWILPNTENLFKTWLKSLTRLLMMYPIIVLIFAAAGMAQAVTNNAGSDDWQKIFTAFLPIAAFYAVPMTFKWAGGAMNAAGGFFTGRASGLSRSVQGSQLAKDMGKARQEKGYLKAQTAKTPFGRIRGRAMSGAGNLMPTSVSRRRLAAGYQNTMDTLGKESRSKLQGDLLDSKITGDSAYAGSDGKFDANSYLKSVAGGHQGASQFERQAAAEMMIDRSAYGEHQLDDLSAQLKGGSAAEQRIWANAQQNKISDLMTKAPQLVQGNEAFKDASAEKIAGLHPKSFDSYMSYLNTASTDPAAEAARSTARANAATNLAQLKATPGQWSKLNADQQSQVESFL